MVAPKEVRWAATTTFPLKSAWRKEVGRWSYRIGPDTDAVRLPAVLMTLKRMVSGSPTCLKTVLTWSAIHSAAASPWLPPRGAPPRFVH
jgi:hypothetical protein